MEPFTVVAGAAAPLPAANVDTDVIMPKQFLKGIDRSGLDRGCFHDLRFDAAGAPRPDFVLNRDAWADARFLVVGPNFGCGSSREHAVWGLLQLGIRAVIGTSFAGIFGDNAANNGLLLITLAPDELAPLMALAGDPARNRLRVDLATQTIEAMGVLATFSIPPLRREALLRGLDAVGTTLDAANAIRAFEARYRSDSPWLFARGGSAATTIEPSGEPPARARSPRPHVNRFGRTTWTIPAARPGRGRGTTSRDASYGR